MIRDFYIRYQGTLSGGNRSFVNGTRTAATPAVLSLPMLSVGVDARRTYCCSHPVRTGFLVPQPYDDELKQNRR